MKVEGDTKVAQLDVAVPAKGEKVSFVALLMFCRYEREMKEGRRRTWSRECWQLYGERNR
jgi:hypothetical protein